jgi:hypothetical protein
MLGAANSSNAITHDEALIVDAKRIVEEAQKRKIPLRILGALAVRLHTLQLEKLHVALDRLDGQPDQFTDVDLMGYSKQTSDIYKMFKELNFVVDKSVAAYFGKVRGIWYHPQNLYHIDVFYDKLPFSHNVDFGSKPGQGRLELDYPTITLADIVLEKAQMHQIGEKDIKDVIVLLIGHEIGTTEKETVNINRICEPLKNDWCFYYEFKINMGKILEFAQKYNKESKLSNAELADVATKINKIMTHVEAEPKSKDWTKRAKSGNTKQWWTDVEEYER